MARGPIGARLGSTAHRAASRPRSGISLPDRPRERPDHADHVRDRNGRDGGKGYLIGQGAFEASGHPVCYVNFPDFTTADIQISVQYLVYGLRKEFQLAGRKVAVIGISQGGLLPRFALTYWPDLRSKVSDVVAAAGTQHGTTVSRGCSAETPCAPANWQQLRHSNLLDALNGQPDETPGNVSYTTVRSLADETVQPQDGKHPTSSLQGASNILIQAICPGRQTSHIGTAVDSVTFAAFTDAVAHTGKGRKGAANVSRFPPRRMRPPIRTWPG